MATLTLTNTLVAGTPEDVNKVQQNFTDITSFVNGSANFDDAKLASPNNSIYRTLAFGVGSMTGSPIANAYLLPAGPGSTMTDASPADVLAGAGGLPLYIAAADYAVAGKTTKLRVRAQVSVNGTAPGGTISVALLGLAYSGAAGVLTVTASGSVASASVVAPPINATTSGAGSDVSLPADGLYALAAFFSGGFAANSAVQVTAQLQMRHV